MAVKKSRRGKRRKHPRDMTELQLQEHIAELAKRHGKVRMIFRECDDDGAWYDSWRKRVIRKNGDCVVAYKSDGYPHFSSYDGSCFVPFDYDKDRPKGLKQTIESMFSHDRNWCKPIELQYGRYYRRKVRL